MPRYSGCLFAFFLWLSLSMEVLATSKDMNPILIICSYNPAAHQTSVTISDYMEGYTRLGGKRDIIIENMNCKSFSEAPLWSGMMTQILAKYQGGEAATGTNYIVRTGGVGSLSVSKGFDAGESSGNV